MRSRITCSCPEHNWCETSKSKNNNQDCYRVLNILVKALNVYSSAAAFALRNLLLQLNVLKPCPQKAVWLLHKNTTRGARAAWCIGNVKSNMERNIKYKAEGEDGEFRSAASISQDCGSPCRLHNWTWLSVCLAPWILNSWLRHRTDFNTFPLFS